MPQITANGIQLEYDERGAGEPLLLIMGLGAQMVLWDERFLDLLAAEGFRVIRFDNRDVGLSAKIERSGIPNVRRSIVRSVLGLDVEAPYTLSDMADDAVGVLDALGIERAHVMGVSMGGMIAQTVAILHPSRISSLTSIMSHTGDRLSGTGRPHAIRALLQKPPRSRDEAIERHVALFRVIGSRGLGADEARLRERAALAYDRCFYPPGIARQISAILASPSRTHALRFVRKPALVVHGTRDPLIRPAGGRATARAIPGAELLMIDGMGHDLPPGAWPSVTRGLRRIADRARTRPQTAERSVRVVSSSVM
jgi:pimeloyl-ACP methyl ester carboxylesterase